MSAVAAVAGRRGEDRQSPSLQEAVRRLRAENDSLIDRNRKLSAENDNLRELLQDRSPDFANLRISVQGRLVLVLLMKHDVVTKEQIQAAMEAQRPNPDGRSPLAHHQILQQVRNRVAPFGIHVRNVYGEGWRLTPEDKARIRDMWQVRS